MDPVHIALLVLCIATAGLVGLVGVLGDRRLFDLARKAEPAPADPWASLVARRAVVNLHDGSAIDGVLVRQDGPLLVLRDAVIHDGTTDDPPMADGELVVDRAQVAYLQFPMT